MMNNAFYFILKAFLTITYSNFCFDFFDHIGKWLDKIAKVNFNFMRS